MSEEQYKRAMQKIKEFAEITKETKLSDHTYEELEYAISKIRSNLVFEVMGLSQ